MSHGSFSALSLLSGEASLLKSSRGAQGTNTIEILVAGYLMSPRYRTATDEAIAEYYDPASQKSKYYDIRNRDPRMFQFGKVRRRRRRVSRSQCRQRGLSRMLPNSQTRSRRTRGGAARR